MTNKSENPREKLYRKMFHSHWVKIVSALASVVVFCTAYALILPAITMSNQDPKCGIEEHTHIAECYDAEGNIICGLEEHAHSLSCYSDLYAAIEDEGYWSADIPELTGDRNADVLAVAQSQIGYRENDENYLISENEQTKGYTRYGHWYGEFVDTESERLENGLSYYAYKDWDAMFVSFVLNYADIYDMGLDSDAGNWAGALGEAGIYVDAADYVPQIGDLIFYTRNAGENMHVGIVSGVNRGFFGNEIKSISVIAGDSNNEVEEIKVAVAEYTEGDITFETIHGYGVLTPGYGVTDESTASEVQPDDSTVAEVAAEEIAGEDVAVEPAVEEAADASEAEEVVNLDNSADHLIGQNEESLDTVEENTEGSALVESVDGAVSEDGSEIVMNWSLSANLPDATLPAGAIIRVDTASAKVHSMTVDQARAWAETAGTGAEYVAFVDNDNYEVTFIGGNGLLYSWADVQNMDAAAATSFTGIHVKALNDVALGEDGTISFNFATTAKVADANVGQNYYVSKVNVNGCAGAATYTYENGKAETVDQNAVLRDAGLDEEPAQKTLVSKKSDYTVTMSYGPEAEIPDGSKLYVKEIKQGTEEYNRYIEDAKAALGISEEDAKELLGRFFDIKIITRDGIFEPKAAVNVNIEYQTAIETEDASAVSAVHFSEDGPQAIEVEAVDVAEPEDEVAMVKSVEFTAESFSVYGIVYTVDFHWEINGEELTYTLKGGDALSFAKLAKEFGLADSYIRSYDEKIKTSDGESIAASDEEEDSTEINETARRFIEQVKSVEFSDPDLIWVERVTEDTATWEIMVEHDLHPEYPDGTTDQEFCEMYYRTFTAPDWVLLSLKAFDTKETLTVTMKTGEVISIEVTDAQDAPMIDDGQGGQIVQTINNPNGTTIDLFDYWITDDLKNAQGMNGWPGHTGDAFSSYSFHSYNYYGQWQSDQNPPMSQDGNDWYVNNNYLRGNGNNQGINNGHVFKFYPGAAGTVEDYGDKGWHTHGTNNAWTNNHDKYSSINSWTGTADPTTGLVQPYLNAQGFPQLTNNGSKGTDGSALNYLFDDNPHAGKQKYEGVNNLLYVNPDGYYTYDSWFYSADLNSDKTFTVKEHPSGAAQGERGFWPFGSRVNWHGMHMKTEFSMPANGQVLNPKGEYKDMEFEFHGDDDTWLYIDGILVGDGGGIHNHTKININFKTGKVIVTGTDDPVADHVGTYTSERYLDDIFRDALSAQGKSQAEINAYIAANFDGHTFKQGSKHTFEMFYLERGGSESNLFIKYNLISTTDFSAHKSYHMLQNDPHARLERDQFKFELIGFDNTDLGTGFQQAIMPANGTPTGDGTYASPKKIYHEATAGSEGYTSLITGVTEDGNVNFGNIQVQASQAGMTYRYMVREVVDPFAENADGIAWKDATEEQRAEGGFIDANGITYDGRVYYFTGTVVENPTGSGKYELKKTRYTDETYSEIDTETKFFSFINGHVEPITLKVLKKSDADNHKPLSGAQFSLVRGKHVVEVDDQGNVTSEKWIPRPESTSRTGTTTNGTLSFNNLTEGHYILEETAAPSGYTRSGDYRWLLTMTKEDSEDEIKLIPTIRPLDAEGHATGDAQTLIVDENHTIEHEILNTKLPRGPLTVEKKWLKPDGTTEYTPEELAEMDSSVQNTQITGELWRRTVADAADPPTVSIYAKLNTESDYQIRWQQQVEPGSTVVFSMAVNGTGYPITQTYTTDTDDTVVYPNGDENITYDNGINKQSGHKFSLSNIEHDVKIYGEFDSQKAGNQNPKIGFKMISYTAPAGTGQQQTIDQKVGDFTLDKNNNWKVTWTSEELNEDDYDYEYYLKNVSEPELEGFTFIDDPEITTDVQTGSVNYAIKNIKDGPMTDLTVRKVWGDNNDHSGQTISYKIQRTEYNAEGSAASAAADYIEKGKTVAEVYTLSASDLYNGIAWQKHHDKLPATNGKEETDPDYRSYKYSVVEVNVPSDYTASYLTITEPNGGDPYDVAVIKNTPTDARVSVEKKWMNNGQTSEITTGIPEGVYITGTLKKTYTWQEATGTTVRVYNRLWANGSILSTTLYRTYNDVGAGTDFKLWAIDSSGNEPLNGVQANGIIVSQTGESRTYNMGGWTKTTNAYVVRINGETQIILDWAYNAGFQNGWHYDVDYTQASGDGQSHTETETVGTFRIDASNDWSWVWTDRELDQDHVYTYFFENVEEHNADGTIVTNFDGFKSPEVGNLTQGADGKWTCTIINEQENLKAEIILKKVDVADLHKDILTDDDLLEGAKFKLEKYNSLQPDEKDEEWNSANSAETTGDGSGTFTFENLPVGYYKIIETEYPGGYVKMQTEPIIWIRKVEGESRLEVVQVDQSGEPLDDTTGEIIRIVPNQTTDPTTIVVGNNPGAALPHTGGPGTKLFTILGSILILGAGVLLWRRRRLI